MIAVTHIPTHRNDGTEVTDQELRAILKRVRLAFNGYSLEGPSLGSWTAADGQVYEEKSYKLEVIIKPKEVKKARRLFEKIGLQLGQRAIYFELREGGEVIDLE